jgi:signal transduction histidine kinase
VGEGDGKFKGSVIATPLVSTFFQHYGNIHDIGSQYLAVLDRDSVQLVHPVSSLVGTPFFGEATQEATGHIEVLNNLVAKVMAGQSGEAVYEFRNGERLTTGYPVYLAGQPTYFVFVITPTSVIYANVADALSAQRIETFSLLAGTTASIFVLIVFLAMWNNNLRKAVIAKTEQLVEANKQLSIANDQLTENYEQLRASERMQKEFINVAAHELRTPIQPIIGLSDLLLNRQHININNRPIDQETRVLLETIRRNARRLYRLSSDILDVTKIESRAMHLEKKEVDILELLKQVVEEAKSQIADGNKIEVVLVTPRNGEKDDDGQMKVFADSQRIQQVISNLLDNAIKFIEQGTITVTAEKKEGGEGRDVIVVKVIDTGSGIHPDVFPQLFTKFVTRSDRGTGLGLYISKSIIEAHGGKIWAENNKDGRGATFSFILPVAASVTTSTAATRENEANG